MKVLNTTTNGNATARTRWLACVAWLVLSPAIFAQKAEIKMLIGQKLIYHAKAILKIEAAGDAQVRVCFFDTQKSLLNDKKLILRARLERKDDAGGKKDVDTVVKLRGADKPEGSFPTLETESDWVGPGVANAKTSHTIKVSESDEAKMRDVIDGRLPLDRILSDEQKSFAAAAAGLEVKDFPWSDLQRYGVIQVWKDECDIGKVKNVTVELWRLTKGKRQLELLEISIKAGKKGSKDKRPVEAIAEEFYNEATAAGLGAATGESKTQKVIDFFKPGIR